MGERNRSFKFLLWTQLVGVTTLSLTAVGSSWWQSGVTLSADGLLTVVLGSKSLQRWLNDTTSQSENQVESGLLLDVVVRQGSTILQLLTSKDQSLLVWWDTLLVLNLRLDVVNGVRGFNLQGNGLTGQGLNEADVLLVAVS
jgi:hypothetical protein